MKDSDHILGIQLERAALPECQYTCNSNGLLGPLSHVNLFIGATNSGKSRLLRSLFSSNQRSYISEGTSHESLKTFRDNIRVDCSAGLRACGCQIPELELDRVEAILKCDEKPDGASAFALADILYRLSLLEQKDVNADPKAGNMTSWLTNIRAKSGNAVEKLLRKKELRCHRIYIPILRGMRPLYAGSAPAREKPCEYNSRTKSDYFAESPWVKHWSVPDTPDQPSLFSGLKLYDNIQKQQLGDPNQQEVLGSYQSWLSEEFFHGQDVKLTSKHDSDVVHVQIGDGDQLPIFQLGDGIQSIILITYPVFTCEESTLFFIEEPDLLMHPSMQRTFVDMLRKFPQHQFFLTTHSNHLLDLTLESRDVSVFLFKEEIIKNQHSFSISTESSGSWNLLQELGVRTSSVFLTNATIWVEGITDRRYISAFLAKHLDSLDKQDGEKAEVLRRLKEDRHYSFVEYQGSVLGHWDFSPGGDHEEKMWVKRVCAKAIVVADGDIETKEKRSEELRRALGDRFVVLKAKEIENYLPEPVVRRAFEMMKAGGATSVLELPEIDRGVYCTKTKGFGSYLDEVFKLNESKFAAPSGTLKKYWKDKICHTAVAAMREMEPDECLEDEIRELCSLVLKHVYVLNGDPENRTSS